MSSLPPPLPPSLPPELPPPLLQVRRGPPPSLGWAWLLWGVVLVGGIVMGVQLASAKTTENFPSFVFLAEGLFLAASANLGYRIALARGRQHLATELFGVTLALFASGQALVLPVVFVGCLIAIGSRPMR